MAKIDTQNIPAELLDLYGGALGFARVWKNVFTVRNRYPWRLPHMQGDGRIVRDSGKGADYSDAQFEHRKIFRKSCDCYNMQLLTHAIVDPPTGPKSRGYWYDAASGGGMWYYDYFMQQTINAFVADTPPVWCKYGTIKSNIVRSDYPDNVEKNWSTFDVYNNFWQRTVYTYIQPPWVKGMLYFKFWGWNYAVGNPASNIIKVWTIEDSWNENSLTWNNRPPFVDNIAQFNVPAYNRIWYAIEIPIASNSVTYALELTNAVMSISFNSENFYDQTFRPYLIQL